MFEKFTRDLKDTYILLIVGNNGDVLQHVKLVDWRGFGKLCGHGYDGC